MSYNEVGNLMQTLDMDNSGDISLEEFSDWYTENSGKVIGSRARNALTKGVLLVEKISGKRLHNMAIRNMRACVMYDEKYEAISEFRTDRPPRFACKDVHCRLTFNNSSDLTLHESDVEFHEKQDARRRALLLRIGYSKKSEQETAAIKGRRESLQLEHLVEKEDARVAIAASDAKTFVSTSEGKTMILQEMQRIEALEAKANRNTSVDDSERHLLFLFYLYDFDGTGAIELNELQALLNALNYPINRKELHQLFKQIAVAGSDEIRFCDLRTWYNGGYKTSQSATFKARSGAKALFKKMTTKSALKQQAMDVVAAKYMDTILNDQVMPKAKAVHRRKSSVIQPVNHIQKIHPDTPEGILLLKARKIVSDYVKTKDGKAEVKQLIASNDFVDSSNLKPLFDSFDLFSKGEIARHVVFLYDVYANCCIVICFLNY